MTTILRAVILATIVFLDRKWFAEVTYSAKHRAGGPRWLAR